MATEHCCGAAAGAQWTSPSQARARRALGEDRLLRGSVAARRNHRLETASQSQLDPHPSRRPALRLRHFRPLAIRIRVRLNLLQLESVTGGGAELSAFSLPGVTKLQCPPARSDPLSRAEEDEEET
ncbi:hypothetical protein PAL_GLEAN10013827 [Pteropus alecto]|uniref:Uncharacterized protein n=1 Tax=Pteropus alecto TaxID=9402 RepID=L5KYI2_PTEAL|nr:hypothetical protein PAL_GLEAN10013827 [Pteropus alecto]